MLDYIQFYTSIWSDKKFKNLKNSDSRILFIYLFTNKNITLTGIYEIDVEECILKSRLDNKEFKSAFDDIIANGLIKFDARDGLIWIVNRFKLILPKSAKVIVGAIEELNRLDHHFKKEFIEKYNDILHPFIFRLGNYKLTENQVYGEEFILNAAKIYNSRDSLRRFVINKGFDAERLDSIIDKVLPNLK